MLRRDMAKRKRRIPESLDVAGAAAFLELSEPRLLERVARRQIPFRRSNGQVIFIRRDLEAFLDALERCRVPEAINNLDLAVRVIS
jgi:hypothetical protein